MPATGLANPIPNDNGVVGIVGPAGTFLAIKVAEWEMGVKFDLTSVAGFGDDGVDCHAQGLMSSVFTVTGWLKSGTPVGLDVSNGTVVIEGTAAFYAGNTQPFYTGTVKLQQFQITTPYRKGVAGCAAVLVGQSGITEA